VKLKTIRDWTDSELSKTPPPPNFGQLFEININVKNFLKSVDA
jgi:hypothetical protein